MKSPNKLLFLFLIISSTFMVASSSNWLTTWMGLEINMLGFIPIMFMKDSTNESEAAVKYLIPQSMGSTIFILSAAMSLHEQNLQILLPLTMCLKLGVAPMHLWFPAVMTNLQLLPAFILLTWQKLGPMFAINSLNQNLLAPTMQLAMITALWGGIAGLNQTDIRSLLTYSSIVHTGWMLTSIYSSTYVLVTYITSYFLINFSIYTCLKTDKTKFHKQIFLNKESSSIFILVISMLSLGGLPPLTGFIMKLLVLYFTKATTMTITILILGTLISLFYYLFLTFSTLLQLNKLHTLKMKISTKTLSMLTLSQILPLSMVLFLF